MNVMIPRIHSHTEEKDAESAAHIDATVDGKGRAEGGLDFMKNPAPKQDMPEHPVGCLSGNEDTYDPMWIDPSKSFRKV